MSKKKPVILFLSASSAVFDTIPEDYFGMYEFRLMKITPENAPLGKVQQPDLIVVDTYSLGLGFLKTIKHESSLSDKPILVIDEFSEKVFASKIMEKGAQDYLNIDNYSERLLSKIQKLVPSLNGSVL